MVTRTAQSWNTPTRFFRVQDDPDNPNKPENPDTKPGKDYIENTTTVYTFGLQVVKKAEKAEGAPLEGVQFDLYKEVPAGTD